VLNQQVLRLYQEGKYQEALPIAEKLLAIRKRVLGSEHPDTAITLNDLAGLYDHMGNYARAEPLFKRVRFESVPRLEARTIKPTMRHLRAAG
jgi:tetratricopeptide (TPR) repeat protein